MHVSNASPVLDTVNKHICMYIYVYMHYNSLEGVQISGWLKDPELQRIPKTQMYDTSSHH